MTGQRIPEAYACSFDSQRRLSPRIWDADYCLLRGLADAVALFVARNPAVGKTVVDFGCGAKPYRGLFPADCRYIGIDVCASRYADLVVQPGERTPLSDGTVDIILSTQVVYLVPDFRNYLSECRRLLASNGRMLITSHGTWTHHPASGGDYYRFTHEGLAYILSEAGFNVQSIDPIVGTLGTGLHLRQLVFNAWLRKLPMGAFAAYALNFITNIRILVEERICALGTRLSSPVILAAVVSCNKDAAEPGEGCN